MIIIIWRLNANPSGESDLVALHSVSDKLHRSSDRLKDQMTLRAPGNVRLDNSKWVIYIQVLVSLSLLWGSLIENS